MEIQDDWTIRVTILIALNYMSLADFQLKLFHEFDCSKAPSHWPRRLNTLPQNDQTRPTARTGLEPCCGDTAELESDDRFYY